MSLIAAMSANRVIGREGRIPWHLSEDLRRFKRITTGHAIVMGRKTWESIGRPLPDRVNVVVTRRGDYEAPGAHVVHALDEAFRFVREQGHGTVFVIGGGNVYAQALPHAHEIHLTLVQMTTEGDAFFPEIDPDAWEEVAREDHGDDHVQYSFLTFKRRA